MRLLILFSILLLTSLGANAQESKKSTGNVVTDYLKGIASYYHDKFEGRKTANGEVFDNNKFTAASNKLKLGSYVKVTNISNGEVVYVKINDRMANNGRVIDLASVAAEKLEFRKKGITKVKVEVVSTEEGKKAILAQNDPHPAPPANEL
jgi:rare lipoprotein A